MRWLGSIIVTTAIAVGLVGATAPRAQARSTEASPSHVESAPTTGQAIVPGDTSGARIVPRRTSPAPDLRLAPFVAATAPTVIAPPRTAFTVVTTVTAELLVASRLPRSSRGPPCR